MRWAENSFFIFILGLIAFVIGGFIFRPNNGIYAAPSKEAVYLAGEACTINMTADRQNIYELAADFEFCMNEHRKHYPPNKN